MAIESLMERRGTFDYILLETTGLADPGNIAPLFWVDDSLGSSIYLDGIVTLVDAKNILRLLDEPAPDETVLARQDAQEAGPHGHSHAGPVLSMAHLQISHADVIILNKADLVTPEELEKVRDRVTAINGAAKVHVTDHSRTPQIEGVVLDLHAYDHVGVDELAFAEKGHAHIDPVRLSPLHLTETCLYPYIYLIHGHLSRPSPQSQSPTPQSPHPKSPALTPGCAPSYGRTDCPPPTKPTPPTPSPPTLRSTASRASSSSTTARSRPSRPCVRSSRSRTQSGAMARPSPGRARGTSVSLC